MAIYTDTFTYADGALAGKGQWVAGFGELDDFLVATNTITGNALDCADYYNGAVGNDQYAQLVVSSVEADGVGAGLGVTLRMATGSQAYYRIVANASGTEIGVKNPTYTLIKNDTTAWADGDVLYVQISGSTITVKRNGTTISALTSVDATLASGRVGLAFSSSSNLHIDNWEGGDLPTGLGPVVVNVISEQRPFNMGSIRR